MKNPFVVHSPLTQRATNYAAATVPKGRTPWRLAAYCVVDLELSGLDPRTDDIISFAAVPIDLGRVVTGGALYGLAKSSRPLPAGTVLVHGIRDRDLVDAPALESAIQPLLAAMSGRILVAHVSSIERAFLRKALSGQGIRLREPILDTYELARLLARERGEPLPSPSLETIAQRLHVPVFRQHHALSDALCTAQVFIALATHLDALSSETVTSLSRAKERVRTHLG